MFFDNFAVQTIIVMTLLLFELCGALSASREVQLNRFASTLFRRIAWLSLQYFKKFIQTLEGFLFIVSMTSATPVQFRGSSASLR